MTTMGELVQQTRSALNGTLSEALSVLAAPYVAGSGVLNLRYLARQVPPGSILSVGLNTFYVIEGDPSGQKIIVLPSYDGGPDVDMPEGSRVEIRPRHTIFRTFRELTEAMDNMCTPRTGLWVPIRWVAPVDVVWSTYPVPAGLKPERVLGVRYRFPGSPDRWIQVERFRFQPEASTGAQITVFSPIPGGTDVEFTAGGRISAPVDLDQNITDTGLPEEWSDIALYAACASLALTGEARRAQPSSQGDPRRAEELPMGMSTSLSREFTRRHDDRVDEEYSRLVRLFPYEFPMAGLGSL